MFQLETPFMELVARGAFLFLLFMALFRILPRRTGGEMAPMDLVFLLLITESASHSLGDFSSLTDGTIQILTMMALNYLTNWLAYRFPVVEKLLEHSPLPVIRGGRPIQDNLRKEALTDDELMGQLRMKGLDDMAQVKLAHVEGDGRLSVVKAN